MLLFRVVVTFMHSRKHGLSIPEDGTFSVSIFFIPQYADLEICFYFALFLNSVGSTCVYTVTKGLGSV